MKKIAMAAGPEMNSLREYELKMEQLEMVNGGVTEEEPDEFGVEIFGYGLIAIKVIRSKYAYKSFEALWDWILDNHDFVKAILFISSPRFGWKYWRHYSRDQQKEYWRKVYNMLPSF